jgi:hypothetical protein
MSCRMSLMEVAAPRSNVHCVHRWRLQRLEVTCIAFLPHVPRNKSANSESIPFWCVPVLSALSRRHIRRHHDNVDGAPCGSCLPIAWRTKNHSSLVREHLAMMWSIVSYSWSQRRQSSLASRHGVLFCPPSNGAVTMARQLLETSAMNFFASYGWPLDFVLVS